MHTPSYVDVHHSEGGMAHSTVPYNTANLDASGPHSTTGTWMFILAKSDILCYSWAVQLCSCDHDIAMRLRA